jgi:hypothetical protein
MIIDTRLRLDHLDKEEMWRVALDAGNDPAIQTEALERWMVMDDQDYQSSIKRMQGLLDLMRTSRFGLPEELSGYAEQRAA